MPAVTRSSVSPSRIVIGAAALAAAAALLVYLNRPAPTQPAASAPSPEVKAYVRQLELSDVTMQASESFTNQQLVEVQGKITNHGERPLKSVDVFCLFYTPEGREIHRERSAVVSAAAGVLAPGATRTFRLPFDALPPGWNQAVPRMVIAGIMFAQ